MFITQRYYPHNIRKPGGARPAGRRAIIVIALLGLFLALPLLAAGQEPPPPRFPSPPPPPPPKPALMIFIDAPGLDPLALVKDMAYARPVPGPEEAQVWVRITSRAVEAGTEFSLSFVGQLGFSGVNDDLKIVAAAGGSPEDTLRTVAQTLGFGLMRYVVRTPLSKYMHIALLDKVSPTAVTDPWNFWVFSLSADAFLMGESTYKSQMYFGNFSAQRVTENLKVRLSVGATIQKDRYDLPDYKYSSSLNSQNLRGLIARSINDHWSIGASVSVYASSFSNTRLGIDWAPGIEYDVFPYSQSTKKQLRLLYQVGFRSFHYIEETIFDRTAETRWGQSLTATLELKQPWGSISTTLDGYHYFYDFSKYRVELNGEISFRILEGLNFNIDGGGSWIRDQLNLAKGGASFEEAILRRKELSTIYTYFFMVGFSYSFGSIRSNIVNPRFGTSGSGGFSMQISM